MFKYGGDVKRQGIMHGMNGLRDGGVATTMADAMGMANGGIMRQGYNQGLSVQPNYMGGPMQNFYESIDDRPDTNIPVPKRMTLKEKIFRKAPNPINFPGPDKIDTSDPKVAADLEIAGSPQKYYADQRQKNKIAKEEAKSIFAPAPLGVYEYDREEGTITDPNKKIDQGEIVAGENFGNKSNLPRVTSNKEKDAARLKRAYEILGVDDAKKDAVYNSLIDLSQAQAIDTKDISGSINRAVGALSRRTDKVTDLKDKAKAALASGTLQADITKEINKEKGTAYDQKEKYFTGKLGDVKGERAAVGSPLSVYDALITTKAGDSKSTRTEQAVTKYFDGIGGVPVYKGPIPGIELESIKINEETEKADGAYRIGTGYIVVEKGIITEKKDLFPKK